jgi:cell division protein FtsX
MKRFSSLLIVLVIIVVSLGFYRGWFTLSGRREAVSHKVDVNLTVDTDKVKEDAETVKDKAAELTGKTTEGGSR